MSRLYLIIIITLFTTVAFSQQELKRYLEFAQEKHEAGDYVYALEYYEKAMKIDSNTINILWNYAETLRAYKDYRKAAFYYGKVYEREAGQLYPFSLLNYGLMLKQCGRYDKALDVFKKGKKKYRRDRRGYLYRKSRKEVKACVWAKSNKGDSTNLIFEALPEHINTPNAEFGHRLHNQHFYFSSLRPDSVGTEEEVFATSYRTHLYTAVVNDSMFEKEEPVDDLFWEGHNTGNGTFSLDGKRFYFSYCEDQGSGYQCKILVAYVDAAPSGGQGYQFVEVDTLGPIINQEGANTTMPFIGAWDEDEVLFFASNREDTQGGMDIYYSFIRNGNQFRKPRGVRRINTMDNELSPYWDNETKTLYFSSSWHSGFGGYDVFKLHYNTFFGAPENMMEPINSPANDVYYFQTSTGDTSFFSSNRLGSNYSKNPTCCSDIYMVRKELAPEPPTIKETLEDLNKRLPVTLYFHNDTPNPNSRDTTTRVDYINSYTDYIAMIGEYKQEYASGLKGDRAQDAKDDIDDFFIEYVKQGVADLEKFRDLLLAELERGRKIQVTVKGFASPLAETDYNVNLAKRRISSIRNYLKSYNGGVFRQYFDGTAEKGGRLSIVEIPFGEYEADQITSDNPNDVQNSVYSRAAAIERKIEIQSVDVIREKDKETTLLSAKNLVYDAGNKKSGDIISHTFTLENTGDKIIYIDEVVSESKAITVDFESKEIAPGETVQLIIIFDTTGLKGLKVGKLKVKYNGLEKGVELSITTELF